MRLLIITNNPERASFRQRIGVYIDDLKSKGIDCEVAELPHGLAGNRKFYRRAKEFDAVFLHKKLLNVVDAFWLGRYARKIIYNFDDAIMYRAENPERNSLARRVRFRRSVRLADMVIVGSSYLAEHAERFNSNVAVLPLGLKVGDYDDTGSTTGDGKIRLVWIGSDATLRYLEAIKPAMEEIGSRYDNVVLRIICDEFLDLENMPVEKCLWSKKTRSADLAACDIGLAPLPDDLFTQGKCSFKVLEYAASGLAVVGSPVGTNVDHIRENVTGFHVSDMNGWVDRIAQLIEDKALRESMGQEGRAVALMHDVSVIGEKLAELICQFQP
jgi:hypothetical protein